MKVRALLAAVALSFAASSCAGAQGSVPAAAAPAGATLGEQSHEAGSVTVAASWINGRDPALRVALDTHSVELDGFDLRDLARVRLDGGSWIAPTAWDAPAGGHHRAGTLTFASVDPTAFASARVIELEVRNVRVPSHLLRWERSS